MGKVSTENMAEARDYLRGILRDGQTLYTTAEGTGQTHYVNVYIAELRDGEPVIRRITHTVAQARRHGLTYLAGSMLASNGPDHPFSQPTPS